ncbi:MAG: MoxR family ATPase [Saprospiraceae bacterium]|nr:MoxR family ATPase [Saprospiraceae bacterium]
MQGHLLNLNQNEELVVPQLKARLYDLKYNFEDNTIEPPVSRKDPVSGEEILKEISAYIISKPLVRAVNAAIVADRPLLLKGEPGCGKTKLARAVAAKYHGPELYQYYFEWHVKSRSRAQEGGYTFDHLQRLRDTTVAQVDPEARERAADPKQYLTLGPMGFAFRAEHKNGKKPILLIDEIDKGDIDFPNDLLLELDEMRFRIHELPGEHFVAAPRGKRPLVFITSNDERELPPAFLRRCLYYKIPPFGPDMLFKIASTKIREYYEEVEMKDKPEITDDTLKKFVKAFDDAKKGAIAKAPSTSELLDWLKLLTYRHYQENVDFEKEIGNKELQDIALKLNT